MQRRKAWAQALTARNGRRRSRAARVHGGAALFLEPPAEFAARLRRLAALLEASGFSRLFLATLVTRSVSVATGDPDATAAKFDALRAAFAPHGDAPPPRRMPAGFGGANAAAQVSAMAASEAAAAPLWEPGLAFAGLPVPALTAPSQLRAQQSGQDISRTEAEAVSRAEAARVGFTHALGGESEAEARVHEDASELTALQEAMLQVRAVRARGRVHGSVTYATAAQAEGLREGCTFASCA